MDRDASLEYLTVFLTEERSKVPPDEMRKWEVIEEAALCIGKEMMAIKNRFVFLLKRALMVAAIVALPWLGFGSESDCPSKGTSIGSTGTFFNWRGYQWMVTCNPPPVRFNLPEYSSGGPPGYCVYEGGINVACMGLS